MCKTKLNLPELNIRTRSQSGVEQVWDDIRKKWLVLTPEEWVRQSFIQFLCKCLGYDPMMIKQEYRMSLYGTDKRADIVVFGRDGAPCMVVECKAPSVRVGRDTLEQVSRYNVMLRVGVVVVTNGLTHYCFGYDADSHTTRVLERIPSYCEIR